MIFVTKGLQGSNSLLYVKSSELPVNDIAHSIQFEGKALISLYLSCMFEERVENVFSTEVNLAFSV